MAEKNDYFIVAETDKIKSRVEITLNSQSQEDALQRFLSLYPGKKINGLMKIRFIDLYANRDAYDNGEKPLYTLDKRTSEYYSKIEDKQQSLETAVN